MPRSPHQVEIDRYLRTGEHDELSPNWPGDNFLARAQVADTAARKALVAAVRRQRQPEVLEQFTAIPVRWRSAQLRRA